MNKIFTLSAALLIGAFASQATITATVNGKPIEHGSTIEINADDFINTPIAGMNFYSAELNIKIVTNAAPVKVNLSCDVQNTIQFCTSSNCVSLSQTAITSPVQQPLKKKNVILTYMPDSTWFLNCPISKA